MSFSFLTGSRGYYLALAAGTVVALTTLGFGFFADDYLHFVTVEGHNDLGSPFDVFVFGNGNTEAMRPYIEKGPYPWFMDLEFKGHFFRPLSSFLMALDYQVFGHCAPAFHAHSILWYILLCLAAMLILRRSLPPAIGVLALLLFVLDESHILPAGWWANRNSVIAVALGFLGVAAHLRWREEQWRPGIFLSLAGYAGGLLASETALGALAYVLAYELFGAQKGIRARFRAAAPVFVIAVGYYAFYRFNGYGAANSELYLDPGTNLPGYLMAAPGRFLMHMGGQFFMLPCEATFLRPSLEPVFIVMGLGALIIMGFALHVLWPGFEERERRALRWLIPGALIATLPSLAAIVNARVLLAPSLGGAAVIAVMIVHAWRMKGTATVAVLKRRLVRGLMWLFIILHLGVSAILWPAQVAGLRLLMGHLNAIMRSIEMDEERIAESQVLVVNAPDPYTGVYPVMLRYFDGLPQANSWWLLSMAPFTHRLTRTGDRELELEIVNGQLCTTLIEKLFRSPERPMRPGDRHDLKGLIITVLETGDSGPSRLRLEFEESPESDRYQILVFRNGGYRRIRPPEMGTSLELPYSLP